MESQLVSSASSLLKVLRVEAQYQAWNSPCSPSRFCGTSALGSQCAWSAHCLPPSHLLLQTEYCCHHSSSSVPKDSWDHATHYIHYEAAWYWSVTQVA